MSLATLIISISALLISFGSFYFQFLRKKDGVICTLTGHLFNDRQVAVQIAISNIGSRPILLRQGRLRIVFKTKSGGERFYDDPNHLCVPNPVLIAKEEIHSVNLSLPLPSGFREMCSKWEADPELNNTNGFTPFFARLLFVTSSGKTLTTEEHVHSIRYVENGTQHLPRKEDSWRVGAPVLGDFEII